ncbi:MAG: hypothetical protein GW818_02880 [Flavobacteriales bacterium]|nr:hypothetical protein [Flavobacteriales bacterium]
MKKTNQIIVVLLLFLSTILYVGCNSNNNTPLPAPASCSDGIQNQGETGIDCGGPCASCQTCSDGIQNQGETGIDCGGPCPACAAPSFTATLNGSSFISGYTNASLYINPNPGMANNLSITASRPSLVDGIGLVIEFTGSLVPGTYNYSATPTLPVFASGSYSSQTITDCMMESGTLTLTQVNSTAMTVSGTFSFTCRSFSNPSLAHVVTNGVFTNIPYN